MASDHSELREGDLSLNQFPQRKFPIAAGILFGLGLGGFLDGIVLHQLLQWHHMLSPFGRKERGLRFADQRF